MYLTIVSHNVLADQVARVSITVNGTIFRKVVLLRRVGKCVWGEGVSEGQRRCKMRRGTCGYVFVLVLVCVSVFIFMCVVCVFVYMHMCVTVYECVYFLHYLL